MADIIIKDVELTFDLDLITIEEYRNFVHGKFTDEEDDEILAKTSGQKAEYFRKLGQLTYRRVLRAFFDKAREPLQDPN